MNKQTEKFKKQLLEISEVVNAFKSEAVQVKIIEKFFTILTDFDKGDNYENTNNISQQSPGRGDQLKRDQEGNYTSTRHAARIDRKPGATRILQQLILSDFFDAPRTISDITVYCRSEYKTSFQTSELSGILLKLIKENKLQRQRNPLTNRFEYVKANQ
ncbi:MAG: hypothetical protein ACOH2A_09315 [Sphingobacteriaceae bacterium]